VVGRSVLVIGLALCSLVPAARAAMSEQLFGFSFNNIESTFDGVSSFKTMDWTNMSGDVYRNMGPAGVANFTAGSWNVGGTLEDFQIAMTITGATTTSATGSGTFTLKDIQGDTISGSLSGTWMKLGGNGFFSGALSNVTYTPVVDDTFNGHSGAVSMSFPALQPWDGTLIELTASGAWFTESTGALRSFDVKGGSLDSTINGMLPAPGALVLALCGMMSAAGLKRRGSL
jgi:hypothetical protein